MNDDKLLVMDKMMQSLISARAAWEKDGGGVRGPQESRSAQQAQAANRENSLKYSSNNSRRDPEQTDFGGRLTTPDSVIPVTQISSGKDTHTPFQITVNGGTAMTIWPGSINGIMPSNMFDTFTVDSSSLWYVVATVTTDGVAVTGAVMSASTTAPAGQTPATNAMPSTVRIITGVYKAGLSYTIAQNNISMTPVHLTDPIGGFTGIWAIG